MRNHLVWLLLCFLTISRLNDLKNLSAQDTAPLPPSKVGQLIEPLVKAQRVMWRWRSGI